LRPENPKQKFVIDFLFVCCGLSPAIEMYSLCISVAVRYPHLGSRSNSGLTAEASIQEQADKEKRGVEAERKDPMSDEFKARLRKEYVGLGGTPNTPINNYFLYIIVGVTGLVVACAALGYI
jgi:hypothetical protein